MMQGNGLNGKQTMKKPKQPEQTQFVGIYRQRKGRRIVLMTRNLSPGQQVYGEQLMRKAGVEYRAWDPRRSKLAAAIQNGLNQLALTDGQSVLYLGASSGTTVSHVSDIVGEEGLVFAVESSPRMVRELVFVAENRPNLIPIMENANHPEHYQHRVLHADFLYQDISQRNQVEIFLKNVNLFLRPNGFCVLCVKARSIDIRRHPKELFREVRMELEKELLVVDARDLYPFQKDHMFYVCKRK